MVFASMFSELGKKVFKKYWLVKDTNSSEYYYTYKFFSGIYKVDKSLSFDVMKKTVIANVYLDTDADVGFHYRLCKCSQLFKNDVDFFVKTFISSVNMSGTAGEIVKNIKPDLSNIPLVAGPDAQTLIKIIRRKYNVRTMKISAYIVIVVLLSKALLNIYYQYEADKYIQVLEYYSDYVILERKMLELKQQSTVMKLIEQPILGHQKLFRKYQIAESNYMNVLYKHVLSPYLLAIHNITSRTANICNSGNIAEISDQNVMKAYKLLHEQGYDFNNESECQNGGLDFVKQVTQSFTEEDENILEPMVMFEKENMNNNEDDVLITKSKFNWVYMKYVNENPRDIIDKSFNISVDDGLGDIAKKIQNYEDITNKLKTLMQRQDLITQSKDMLMDYVLYRQYFFDEAWPRLESIMRKKFMIEDIKELIAAIHEVGNISVALSKYSKESTQEGKIIYKINTVLSGYIQKILRQLLDEEFGLVKIKRIIDLYPFNENAAHGVTATDFAEIFNGWIAGNEINNLVKSGLLVSNGIENNLSKKISELFKLAIEIKSLVYINSEQGFSVELYLQPSEIIHKVIFNIYGDEVIYLNQDSMKILVPIISENRSIGVSITRCSRDIHCTSYYYNDTWAGLKFLLNLKETETGQYCLMQDQNLCVRMSKNIPSIFMNKLSKFKNLVENL
jgi:hypothetical protein